MLSEQNLKMCVIGLAFRWHTYEDAGLGARRDKPMLSSGDPLGKLVTCGTWKAHLLPTELEVKRWKGSEGDCVC